MDMFRCDFNVDSDLVLHPTAKPMEIILKDGYSLKIWNASLDTHGNVPAVIIAIIGPAPSFEEACDELRSVLARQLDILSFVTHARFKIVSPRRLFDWNAKQVKRRLQIYANQDARYPPVQNLNQEFINSVMSFANAPEFVLKALRNFRYGLLESAPEDQFVRLWLALEIIAVKTATRDRPGVTCRKCGVAAKCASCGKSPPPVTSAKSAIIELTERIVGKQAKPVYTKLFAVRNGLMHGKSNDSVIADANVTWGKLLEVMGRLTWDAIVSASGLTARPPAPHGDFAGNFANSMLVAGALGTFDFTGEGDQPDEALLPDPKVDILYKAVPTQKL